MDFVHEGSTPSAPTLTLERPIADDEQAALEVLALKIELDLVPEWSNTVERIGRHHGEAVEVGLDGGEVVVKIAVRPEQRDAMLTDVRRCWELFVERRKREGRWRQR